MTRSDVDQMTDSVVALAFYSQFGPRQDVIISVLSSEFDWKIEKAAQAQSDTRALMQELITLRLDTNAVLETHSSPRLLFSDGFGMEDILTVEQVDDPEKMFQFFSTLPVLQTQATLGTSFFTYRNPQATLFFKIVRNYLLQLPKWKRFKQQ